MIDWFTNLAWYWQSAVVIGGGLSIVFVMFVTGLMQAFVIFVALFMFSGIAAPIAIPLAVISIIALPFVLVSEWIKGLIKEKSNV